MGLKAKGFEGFNVVVVDGFPMTCTKWVPQLNIALRYYTLTNNFYMVDLVDTNAIFGI